jgi:hypothetical protein
VHPLLLVSVTEPFMRQREIRLQLKRFAELVYRAVVLPDEEEDYGPGQIEAERQWLKLGGALNFGAAGQSR